MSEIVYLNGQYLPQENAILSPNDRGFIFADGIYEVTKYYKGKPFRLDDHLKRLERSLHEIGIFGIDVNNLKEVFSNLLEKNDLLKEHGGVYLQITRGVHKRVHHFPANIEPTVYGTAFPMPSNIENLEKGIKVITHDDIRWLRCDIKSVSLLANTMIYNKAVDSGAGECLLFRNGYLTEATHSSVLAVKNGKVITHPLSNLILPGITRKVILELCVDNNLPVEERPLSEQELYEVDELMIAGTGSEITPVVQVNDKPIGNKKPGDITRLLQTNFFKLI